MPACEFSLDGVKTFAYSLLELILRADSRRVARQEDRPGGAGAKRRSVRISKRSLLHAVSLNNKKNDDHYRWIRQSGLLATIPFLLAVPPIVGVVIGRWLDERFGTGPLFTVILLIFGFIAGIREVAAVLKKADSDTKTKKSKGP